MEEQVARHYQGATTSRVWTPIDNCNQAWYEAFRQRNAVKPDVDFDKENKVYALNGIMVTHFYATPVSWFTVDVRVYDSCVSCQLVSLQTVQIKTLFW